VGTYLNGFSFSAGATADRSLKEQQRLPSILAEFFYSK